MSRRLVIVIVWMCCEPFVMAAGVMLCSPRTGMALALYIGAITLYCSLPTAAFAFRLIHSSTEAAASVELNRMIVLRILKIAVPLSAVATALLGAFTKSDHFDGSYDLLFAMRVAAVLVALIAAVSSYAIASLIIKRPIRP